MKKNHVLGIFIDLSKAFDTISHEKLLCKLYKYGIRGNTHALIGRYLSNRKQYVSVLGENSDELSVLFGVPQGSVLGPLLFIIYSVVWWCSGNTLAPRTLARTIPRISQLEIHSVYQAVIGTEFTWQCGGIAQLVELLI